MPILDYHILGFFHKLLIKSCDLLSFCIPVAFKSLNQPCSVTEWLSILADTSLGYEEVKFVKAACNASCSSQFFRYV